VLAELIPAQKLLDSPYWSDSEGDEEDLLLHKCDRFFPSDSEDAFDSEAEEMARLQGEYEALLKASEGSKRFGSPVKGHNGGSAPKIRRTFKHLPVNEAGKVEFPVILGRGPNRISISKIGPLKLVSHDDGSTTVPVPLDYECRRKYWDYEQTDEQLACSDNKKQTYYMCSISASNMNALPFYRIMKPDSDGIESDSIIAVWSDFRAKFPPSMLQQLDEDFLHPRAFFGLEHDNLLKYFKDSLAIQ